MYTNWYNIVARSAASTWKALTCHHCSAASIWSALTCHRCSVASISYLSHCRFSLLLCWSNLRWTDFRPPKQGEKSKKICGFAMTTLAEDIILSGTIMYCINLGFYWKSIRHTSSDLKPLRVPGDSTSQQTVSLPLIRIRTSPFGCNITGSTSVLQANVSPEVVSGHCCV